MSLVTRRTMLTAAGAAVTGAGLATRLSASAPSLPVSIVRCRDYSNFGPQLAKAFDQMGGI